MAKTLGHILETRIRYKLRPIQRIRYLIIMQYMYKSSWALGGKSHEVPFIGNVCIIYYSYTSIHMKNMYAIKRNQGKMAKQYIGNISSYIKIVPFGM